MLKTTLEISKKDLERINFLLSKDLSEMTNEEKDKNNAKEYDIAYKKELQFNNKDKVYYIVRCESNNYYDEIYIEKNNELISDNCGCLFELNEGDIEVILDDETYIIEVKIKGE